MVKTRNMEGNEQSQSSIPTFGDILRSFLSLIGVAPSESIIFVESREPVVLQYQGKVFKGAVQLTLEGGYDIQGFERE